MSTGEARDSRLESGPGRPNAALLSNGSESVGASRPQWARLHLWEIQGVRDVLVGLGIFGLLWLGYKLSIVTVPILLAMALAYLFEPVVKWLTRPRQRGRTMSREAAASIIIGAAVLIVVVPVSLGLVFAVGQGIQVGNRVARVVQLSAPIVQAIEVIGSPFDEEGKWIGFQAAAEANAAASPAGIGESDAPVVAEGVSEGAPSGNEANDNPATQIDPRAEEVVESSAEQGVDAPGDGDADVLPARPDGGPVDSARLAVRADAAWTALGADFSALQVAYEWAILTFGDADAEGGDSSLGRVLGWLAAAIDANLGGIAERGVWAAQAVISKVVSFGMFLFMLFLTAFFFYFFSVGYGRVLAFWRGLIPEARKHRVVDLAQQMDAVIAGFIRGRLTIAAIQAVFFTIAYWVIGVPAPLIIGPIVAVLSIVPYVALVGIPITVIGMLIDPPTGWQAAWWWILGAPTVVYFAGQALDDYILTPLIQGKSTDMATPSILFASIAGGALAGLYGLLLAIPVAACLKILLREVFWPRFRQWADGKQRDFLPISGSETD